MRDGAGRLRSGAAPFKVACSPTIPGLQAEASVFERKCRLFKQKCPGLTGSLDQEVAMATERQREIKRRRKRREKRLKARTREARKHKKKR
jgi:hypothetical protein